MWIMVVQRNKPIKSAGTTQIHAEITLWNEVEFRVDGYHDYDVSGLIRLHAKRLELDEFKVSRMRDGKEITGYGLRELQPPTMIRRSLSVLRNYPPDDSEPDLDDDQTSSIFGSNIVTHADIESARTAGPSSRESLFLVSKIYMLAQAIQDRPAKAIQELFGVSPRTAGNWIAKSKAAGFIETGEDNG